MFLHRYTPEGFRKAVDLYDIFHGGSVFLCGGHPSLKGEDLSQFSLPGVTTMAMNNTATVFRPTIWVSADKPECYSESVIRDPGIMKFVRLVRDRELIRDANLPWKRMPNTYFYGVLETDFTYKNLLHRKRGLAWWLNIFVIALQLSYHLGFRKIYLCGVGLSISKEAQYAYQTALTDQQVKTNTKVYSNVYEQLKGALPHYREHGLEIVCCTPNSRANELVPFMPLEDAIKEARKGFPEHDTLHSLHSSETNPEGTK